MHKSIERRLENMPKSYRADYRKAMTGKSRKAAMDAMCRECCGWDRLSETVGQCTDLGCPLYPYRPYQ